MDHVCSSCGSNFPVTRDRRSPLAWGVGLRGIYTTDYGRAIDHFNVVVCPNCAHAETEDRLRVFGLFTPRQFKVIAVAALALLAAAGLFELLGIDR